MLCPKGKLINVTTSSLVVFPGLGHAYFIALYALKNKAKIRELKKPGFKCGPPPRRPFLLVSSLGDFT